jgi:hypothetical protein
MFSSTLRALQNSRVYAWAMRLPAALYSFYAIGHDVAGFYRDDPSA